MSVSARVRWSPTVAMLLVSLISYLDRNTLAVLAPTILRETGLSGAQYGTVISAFSLCYMLGNPLWGYLLDRVGLRRGMTWSVSLWTAASAAHAFVGSFFGFAAARAVLGFGEGATFPGGLRTAQETLPTELRSRGMAIAYSGGSLGAIVTPLLVTPIAAAHGWRSAFVVTGVVGLCWLVAWRLISRPLTAVVHAPAPLPRLTEARLWALIFSYAFGALPLAFTLYAAPLYLGQARHVPQGTLGKILWLPPLGWEVGYFCWGWIADRYAGSRRATGRWFVLLALAGMPFALTPFIAPLAGVMAMFVWSMWVASGFIVLGLRDGARAYPAAQTGLVAGIGAGSWSALVAIIMPVLGSYFDQGRYQASFVLTALFPIFGVAGWLLCAAISSTRVQVSVRL